MNPVRHRISVAALFFISGAAALVFEVVWSRQLQLFFGSTVQSVAIVLAAFFLGMVLGSYCLGRWGPRDRPLRTYAALELGIGLYALAIPLLLPFIDTIHIVCTAGLSWEPAVVVVRAMMAAVLLLVPCTLMGGTLPVLSRIVGQSTDTRARAVGWLYTANTAGAVTGTLAAGFILIERLGLTNTTRVGAAANLACAGIAMLLSCTRNSQVSCEKTEEPPVPPAGHGPEIAFAVSGFCALGYEVLWTRGLIQTLGASSHTLAGVLAVVLAGSAIGSAVMASFAAKLRLPRACFAGIQALVAISVMAGGMTLTGSAAVYDYLVGTMARESWQSTMTVSVAVTALYVLIPSLLFGALFPIAVKWGRGEVGRSVGRLIAANTAGGILGSLAGGFLLIPVLGTGRAFFALASINILVALWCLSPHPLKDQSRFRRLFSIALIAMWCLAAIAAAGGHAARPALDDFRLLFHREGSAANIDVFQCTVPGRDFKILRTNNIYLSGGTDPHALMVQRRQGHLPMMLHDNPDSVLVIGLATGITLSAVAEHAARYIECVELVHSQIEVLRFFEPENRGVARDARVRFVIDDGRNHVRRTPHRYDVIVSDLFQVHSGGTGNLYAREHVRACREKLREGGLLVQWFPLQQMTVRSFRSALRSYTEEFPYVQLWLCDVSPEKPVAAAVASMKPLQLDFDRILARIGRATSPTAASVGYDDPYFFLSQCIMQDERLREYAGGAPLNTYDRPVVEYSAARQPLNTGKETVMSLMSAPSPLRLEAERDEDLTLLREYARAHYRNLLSQLAGSSGRWDRAEEILEETIAAVPRNPDTRRLLGRAKVLRAAGLIEQGRRHEASVKLDSARLLGIDDPFVTRLEALAKEP